MRLPARLGSFAVFVVLAAVAGCGEGASGTSEIQLLAINDFHGALEPRTDVGGAAYLATHLAVARTDTSIFVSAGDLVGGSPLVSGLFHDEPTIDVMNQLGLALNGVGNHEFDEGGTELVRLATGGCHPVDGCQSAATFSGATFSFLAANVFARATGETIFPPYEIRVLDGLKVAFVGLTLEDTPGATLASAVTELEFRDEADTVNALVPELRAIGVDAIFVLLHEGGAAAGADSSCVFLTGRVVDVVERMDDLVKLVLSGHTHNQYSCQVGDKLVTSAGSAGVAFTDVRVTWDRRTRQITTLIGTNRPVDHAVQPDATIAALVAHYQTLASSVGDRVVATIGADLPNSASPAGDTAMGRLVADAMLESAASEGAVIALMNAGGIRGSLAFAKSGAETIDGQVRYAEAFAVQPFGNTLRTVTITGAELEAILEGAASGVLLHVAGLTYAYDANAAAGARVDPADVRVGGAPLALTGSYRVIANSIVTETYPALAAGQNPVGGGVDLDALITYLSAHSPIAGPSAERVTLK